ncbi:MAG: hypothetical protein AB9879_01220 [Methanothrix sp.]
MKSKNRILKLKNAENDAEAEYIEAYMKKKMQRKIIEAPKLCAHSSWSLGRKHLPALFLNADGEQLNRSGVYNLGVEAAERVGLHDPASDSWKITLARTVIVRISSGLE